MFGIVIGIKKNWIGKLQYKYTDNLSFGKQDNKLYKPRYSFIVIISI